MAPAEDNGVRRGTSNDAAAHDAQSGQSGDRPGDEAYYARRAAEELDSASKAFDVSAKKIHLDLAARYATLRELAARRDAHEAHADEP